MMVMSKLARLQTDVALPCLFNEVITNTGEVMVVLRLHLCESFTMLLALLLCFR